uniref:KH domain-containing protein n=1 Tax=Trichuris muris TaxID=70415 RepID=A0A5S6QNK5_TRIMR
MGGSTCSRGGRKNYRRERSDNRVRMGNGNNSSTTLTNGCASGSEDATEVYNGVAVQNGIDRGIAQMNGFVGNDVAPLPSQSNLYIITAPAAIEWNPINGVNGMNGVSPNGTVYSPSCVSESSLEGSGQWATMGATSALASPAPHGLPILPIYNFEVPNDLVGLLIGRNGAHVQYLQNRSGASVSVYSHWFSSKSRLCAIEGSRDAINSCLRLIRRRFPVRFFPQLKLNPVFLPGMLSSIIAVPLAIRTAELQELDLVEGMLIETSVCFTYSPAHFFVHQPTHPSYMHLSQFQAMINFLYERDKDIVPNLNPVTANSQCVAFCENGWYRATVYEVKEEDGKSATALVKLLDCGGYFNVPVSALKQMRVECTGFPIQSNEIILFGVEPADGTGEWSREAKEYFERQTELTIILTRVKEALPSGAKLSDVFLANQELRSLASLLVEHGFAKFTALDEEASAA